MDRAGDAALLPGRRLRQRPWLAQSRGGEEMRREWITARARRLFTPVIPLLVVWVLLIVVMRPFVDPSGCVRGRHVGDGAVVVPCGLPHAHRSRATDACLVASLWPDDDLPPCRCRDRDRRCPIHLRSAGHRLAELHFRVGRGPPESATGGQIAMQRVGSSRCGDGRLRVLRSQF